MIILPSAFFGKTHFLRSLPSNGRIILAVSRYLHYHRFRYIRAYYIGSARENFPPSPTEEMSQLHNPPLPPFLSISRHIEEEIAK